MADSTKTAPVTQTSVPTVTLTIDGRAVSVPKGTTVLLAAKQLGIDIPTFCWHPKLKPVGACRMCYVEVEKMPKLQVSCSLEAMDGMVVYTQSEKVKQGRKAIIEFTLINHPLDCPTCDKGGECDLQNLTFAHGYDDSRFEFQKYRFVEDKAGTTFDDIRIGPEIILNRNRCILCYKCVRANKEAFGEYDLGAYERGNITEINAAPGEVVDNPFSGNLVEICPVGALTNTDWRYKIRVWLTKTTPSICNFTSSGSNIRFWKEDHRNHIFRVTSRRNDDIDDGWLPDVTRYGYQIASSPERLTSPLIKKNGKQVAATWDEALDLVARRLGEIRDKLAGVCLGGMIAPHLDNASLHSFSKLMRHVLKSNNVDYRGHYRMLPKAGDSPFSILSSQRFSIADIDNSDIIVAFGSDLVREHQNEYLRIRKAQRFGGARVYSLSPYGLKSADVATLELIYGVGREEAVVLGICLAGIEAGLVDNTLGRQFTEKARPNSLAEAARMAGVTVEDLTILAKALSEGKKITVIAGEIVTKSSARDTISAALLNMARLFGLYEKGQMTVLARYANSKGAELLGVVPEPPQRLREKMAELWREYPSCPSHNTDAMMALIKKEELKGFMVVGANPMMLYPDQAFVTEALEKLDFLVVCDLFETATTELADVVLPICSWAEYTGDYTNLEGRVQHAEQAIKPRKSARPAHAVLSEIAERLEMPLFASGGQRQNEIEQLLSLDPVQSRPEEFLAIEVAVAEPADEGTVPMFLVDDPHHVGHLTEKAQSLMNFSGEAYIEMSASLAQKVGVKAGQSLRVESDAGKVIVPVRISEFIENDVVLLPRNFTNQRITSLLMRKKRIDRVRLTRVE